MIKLFNLKFKENKPLSNVYNKYFTCITYPCFHIKFNNNSFEILYRSTVIRTQCYVSIRLFKRTTSHKFYQDIINQNLHSIIKQFDFELQTLKQINSFYNDINDGLQAYNLLV